jgi:hypothetical protein
LAAFRARLKAFPALVQADPRHQITIDLLNRWLAHPEAEAIWTRLREKLPSDVSAGAFAYGVVQRRLLAEKFSLIIREAPGLEAKGKVRTKRHSAQRKYAQVASENALLDDFVKQRERLLGRQKSAPHSRFMRELGEKFRELCDQPLDDVVRVLTEIAFGEGVSLDAVRGAQRAKTREGRRSKRRDTRPLK